MSNNATSENEMQLIQAFNQGNEEARREILRRFYKPIVHFAKSLINNQEESEEIASDYFLKLFRNYSNFKTLLNVRAYLYVSIRNACLNRLAAKKTEIKRLGKKISLSDYRQRTGCLFRNRI
jgi:RNA polymerase sigma factor (sigma-70 family)